MNVLVVDDVTGTKLAAAMEPLTVCDAGGRRLGVFTPEPICPWDPTITLAELDRRAAEDSGCRLGDFMHKLEGDGRTKRPPADVPELLRVECDSPFAKLQKDAGIIALLTRLSERLGPDAFVIVDHWEGDPNAVGIASPRNRHVLAYLSNFGSEADSYFVELELPPEPDRDFPYTIAESRSDAEFEIVVEMVRRHLASAVD